jgi:hypothetical protein
MTKEYKLVNGTSYNLETSEAVVKVLEKCRHTGNRIRVEYGDVETGRGWGDDYDVTGTVKRSMGPTKVPLLLHNARSSGGGAMLDHCVVAIMTSIGAVDLYRHPTYQPAHDWKNAVLSQEDNTTHPFKLLAPKIDDNSNDYVAYFQTAEKRANYLKLKMAFNYRDFEPTELVAGPKI